MREQPMRFNIPKGMYVVRVNIGNEVLTEKVIVK